MAPFPPRRPEYPDIVPTQAVEAIPRAGSPGGTSGPPDDAAAGSFPPIRLSDGRPAPAPDRKQKPTDQEGSDAVQEMVRAAPPWLVSGIVHMVLLIVLGLIALKTEVVPNLLLEATTAKRPGVDPRLDGIDVSAIDAVEEDQASLASEQLPVVEDPGMSLLPELAVPWEPTVPSDALARKSLQLSGRERGRKAALLAAYGGTAATESAVADALAWLARNQRRDGSWSLSGPYASGATNENPVAATAMALLAFQGAGFTHIGPEDHEYQQVAARGSRAMLKFQQESGAFFQDGIPAMHRLYTHAQCTIALCELYGMTRDEALREPAQLAVDYCVRSQDELGGWRYYPRSGSDTSVTGWFVMALASAQMAYLDVPQETLRKIDSYLDQAATDQGRQYLYMPGNVRGGLAMNAEGLLCRQYLGWKRDDPRLVEGVQLLLDNPMNWEDRDVYYWYYATQVCHHMEGPMWRQWNDLMRELLPAKQVKDGVERGSWHPQGDAWGDTAGRLYVTCLSVYMLEVYYRHLPLYQHALFAGEGVRE
ncbi:MAG: prenyltransferase/squalene oxidase repeat-containing protein [Pirellulales bacterium]